MTSHGDRIEARLDPDTCTTVPSDYFDRLLASLDEPVEPMPELAVAAARHRADPRFTRS